MTAIEKPLPTDDLPVLTEVAEDAAPDDLPTLTEIVEDIQPALPPIEMPSVATDELPVLIETVATEPPAAWAFSPIEDAAPPPSLSDADMQLLTQRIEAHIESVFAQKLNQRLEQLQRQAVDKTVAELKTELPQILHDALRDPDGNR